ncbi:MAG: imidazole glycerol phosphate synthase subunit HisH [Bacteroidetes bacterium]|nr:imidazole glycerol phosphate synthase subunit HisH [Bacteroidota bacterium]
MITIINYGMGNLGSVLNMCKRIGAPAKVSGDLDEVSAATKLILPGVGAFDNAMKRICDLGLYDVLDQKARFEQIPILGICLGMQLLMEGSEEGKLPGFGWIKGHAKLFPSALGIKVPHMGWNLVKKTRPSQLIDSLDEDSRFYFVHSYFVQAESRWQQLGLILERIWKD